ITRDNGLQDIKWIGRRCLTEEDLLLSPRLRPVMIRAGALGEGIPETDTLLSPNQRVLVPDTTVVGALGDGAVLVAAIDLSDLPGVELMDPQDTTYVHLIFGGHEMILCNGGWIDSFHAGDIKFRGEGNAQRLELLELYPELRKRDFLVSYESKQRTLKKSWA
ncbi:MAG: Hint domain-containing protein, partial [Roseibium sp.]